eukprot:TRINITY_DN17180_c0_g1_i1.p1 TRINITY_DN17180_c0_g1~~TRINITY_DN17180_c0_g1_i1.p1  ORF type:complete len:219 (+),score=22.44 TRINITY_DN17180_c0_g1_i1:66-722(+)
MMLKVVRVSSLRTEFFGLRRNSNKSQSVFNKDFFGRTPFYGMKDLSRAKVLVRYHTVQKESHQVAPIEKTADSKPFSREDWKKYAHEKLEAFNRRKAAYILQYGSSFFLVHELLGISSYLITYSLLHFHIIPMESIVSFLGWTDADLQRYGIDLNSKLVTFAMTVAIVKGLDVMGLVPLRWTLTFLITPRVARYVGPTMDAAFLRAKNFVQTIKGKKV